MRRQCRAGACDDRPECPQSPCRCLYPSRADCALYYQCVQGKPRQYRCSQGLLFNEDTLTCDYDFNVDCALSSPARTAGRTPKAFALQGDPSRSRRSSDLGAVLKYSLRQAVTSHGVFSCIPFPSRNIEKRVAFSGIIYLSPRSGVP
ncbi:hypothetical protein AVEN_273277-1 [Araneus ventricosus]|uniref:Chitin-binding type-2 domain-containing protein n=1 Tax=Araneus ventricosus TaxID=182803 RepID=A0A4Y2EWV8_ARAVE|nr:hypothetical protein AVEN_273277-1 [Araneus ventricosus]